MVRYVEESFSEEELNEEQQNSFGIINTPPFTKSVRVIKKKIDDLFNYSFESSEGEFSDSQSDESIVLGVDKNDSLEISSNSEKFDCDDIQIWESISFPTTEECMHILNKTPKGSHTSLQLLQNSYFCQLFELIFGGEKDVIFFHSMKETESYKKRILESVLLLPLTEILETGIKYILKENFLLNSDEILVVISCFKSWLLSEENKLPFSANLADGTVEYWKHLENYTGV
jgi:hypothetical protein